MHRSINVYCSLEGFGRSHAHFLPSCLQQPVDEASSLIDVANEVINSKACRKADPSQFELLKVLGQGSFGKVIFACLMLLSIAAINEFL